jgi:hypothetical protein
VTGLGPGSSAITWAGRRVAEWIGRPAQPEPYLLPAIEQAATDVSETVREQLPHTGLAWLREANQIREQLPTHPYDDRDWVRLDGWALERLARLSEQMTPWDAAMDTFGTSNPQPRGDT